MNELIEKNEMSLMYLENFVWLLKSKDDSNRYRVDELVELYRDEIDKLNSAFDELRDKYGDLIPADCELQN
jgi:hypothetical protein